METFRSKYGITRTITEKKISTSQPEITSTEDTLNDNLCVPKDEAIIINEVRNNESKAKPEDKKSKELSNAKKLMYYELIWLVVDFIITSLCFCYCFVYDSTYNERVDTWLFSYDATIINWWWWLWGIVFVVFLFITINKFEKFNGTRKKYYSIKNR